jgi:hypothetical protein
MKHVVGLSGGKDSTAMALCLAEVEPQDYTYIITPTGDELPEMVEHWKSLEELLGKPLVRITNNNRTLNDLIQIHNALPNHRQRWCTRQLKIEPTIAWCIRNAPAINYVGLRADEEEREGIYGDHVKSDFPLRRWGWGLKEVLGYLKERGITIPDRTDCARCYAQRLSEWKSLWLNHPDIYADAVRQEKETGRTFRSPNRDKWPAGLEELAKEFASGRKIRGEDKIQACRVCTL